MLARNKELAAISIKPYYPGEHITLIGAMALTEFLGGMTLDGGTNGQAFRVFVKNILVPSLWPGAYVLMDNLPAHKVQGIQEMIESAGAKVIYLSFYSPDFNPIENCWSKLKQYLRSCAARSRHVLEEAVMGLDSITSSDIRSWFAHCCYCTL